MERTSPAIVLHTRPFGEGEAVVTLFTLEYGKVRGLVRGARKKSNTLQAGNLVEATHRKRLENQLGTLTLELTRSSAGLAFSTRTRLAALTYVVDLLHHALPEEQPFPRLYDTTDRFLTQLGSQNVWEVVAAYELDILAATGFGLDFSEQNAVREEGDATALMYVSPKTGRPVSQHAGERYKERLFLLPTFFGGKEGGFLDLFKITGHFLRAALEESLPESRSALLEYGIKSDFKDA